MSTKAPPARRSRFGRLGPSLIVALMIGGCAGTPQTPVRRFGELRLGAHPDEAAPPRPPRVTRAAPASAAGGEGVVAAPTLRPRIAAPIDPSPVLPVSLETAVQGLSAYLGHAGFALEQAPDGPGRLVTATRMGAPQAVEAEAVCGLEAMHRPDIASTELTVHVTPAPGGVRVDASARFVEVDTRLLSGTLTRQTCRSRGVLEAAVRRAALAG